MCKYTFPDENVSVAETHVTLDFHEIFSKSGEIVLMLYALIAASMNKLKSPEKVLMEIFSKSINGFGN
jgi:hypothetical protein